uniref:Si:dkeyp-110a12.4 n=1 Tax=Stegastes partitus TaxID=144197 RepID=A0A3B5B584_9TELE
MAPASLVFAWLLFTARMVSSTVYLQPEEELNETVICTNDHMEVIIPSAFFLNKVPPVYVWDLHLNDPDCRGVEVGDDYVFSIKTNLSDCGTTITLNTEDGNFSVSMLLYKDEAFQDRWTTVPSLTLDDNIFVKVFMIPAHLMLRMERCWATPTSDPYSNIQYTFIRDCPVLTNAQTLSVLKNGLGPEATFRIQMFKFVGSSYTNVFLHCNVQICHGGPGLCQPNCSSDDGLMRTRRDIPLSHTVSYGPIRRLLNDSEKPNLPAVETFVLGGLLVVLLLITGVFGRLWLRSRRFYPAREAQLTLSNIHHISE